MVPQRLLRRNQEAHGAGATTGAYFLSRVKLGSAHGSIVQPAKGYYVEEDYEETDERSDFMKFLSRWRGDCGFGLAENKWLYGNDL